MTKDIYIFGDLLCPEKDIVYFDNDKQESLIGEELNDIIRNKNNFCIVNLEGPITNSTQKQHKGGSPNLKSSPSILRLLGNFSDLLISGANNHITDYGIKGLTETKAFLDGIGVPYIGFGIKTEELYKTYDFKVDGKTIRVVSFAQNEFCTMESALKGVGATPYDPLIVFDLLKEYKNSVDYTIVLFHGGKENYQYPTPMQRTICQKMITAGADLVVCQHSHCVGCEEKYDTGTIIYGTGNFIFNISDNELWSTSLVVHIFFENGNMQIDYVPIVKECYGVRIAKGEQGESIISAFSSRSNELLNEGFVEKKWSSYCDENKYTILWNAFFRYPRVLYWFDRLLNRKLSKILLSKRDKNLLIYNYIRCEAINEMCQTIFYDNEKMISQNADSEN